MAADNKHYNLPEIGTTWEHPDGRVFKVTQITQDGKGEPRIKFTAYSYLKGYDFWRNLLNGGLTQVATKPVLWTPEKVELLRQLAPTGLGLTEIGRQLGTSGNSVKGKAIREGIVVVARPETKKPARAPGVAKPKAEAKAKLAKPTLVRPAGSNPHRGESFDSLLESEGLGDEIHAIAGQGNIARQPDSQVELSESLAAREPPLRLVERPTSVPPVRTCQFISGNDPKTWTKCGKPLRPATATQPASPSWCRECELLVFPALRRAQG